MSVVITGYLSFNKHNNNFTTLQNTWCTYLMVYFLIITLASVQFQWPESDDRFDCIVGITVDNVPVGVGTLVYDNFIITSANPLEQYLVKKNKNSKTSNHKYDEYTDPKKRIKFHAIRKAFNESKLLKVTAFNGNIAKRNISWIRMGFNRTHSPIHDLLAISIKEKEVQEAFSGAREAYYYASSRGNYFTKGWTFAGFGYVDRNHVNDSTVLDMTVYEDSALEDCDEWIPRAWGRFICLLNVENLIGIQSGAPLFYQGILRGIGCFALQKGKESILVFTDYTLYSFDSIHNKTLGKPPSSKSLL